MQDYDPSLTIAADGKPTTAPRGPRSAPELPARLNDRSCSATSSIWTSTTKTSSAGRCRRSPTSHRRAAASIRPGVAPGQTLVRTLVTALIRSEAWRKLGVPVDLRRVGRMVRPRATARGPRVSRTRATGQSLREAGRRRQRRARPHVDSEVHRGELATRAAGHARQAGEEPRRRVRLRRPSARAEAHRRRPELCVARESAPLADLSALWRRRDACRGFDRGRRLSSRAGSARRDGGGLRALPRGRRLRTPRVCRR